MPYSHSSGTAPPHTRAPAYACDCHLHVYDPRFPDAEGAAADDTPQHAAAGDYRRIQQRLGTERAVIVQPRVYGTDNRATLDAIAQLGADRTRGVAVVTPAVTDAELQALHAGGIRGVRLSLTTADPKAVSPTRPDMLEPLAARIAPLGWHVQLHVAGEQIVAYADVLRRLPCPVVFDHLARLPHGAAGPCHAAFGIVRGLLLEGRAWLKLSGAYLNTDEGPPAHADTHAVAQAWLAAAPDRLVWGSDWPHPAAEAHPRFPHTPDDAQLFDLLAAWVPDAAQRDRILVDNPARLYGFA
ncbi:MAG: amidohydrolase family protein [Pseudomonadota bacterium]